MHHVRLLAAPHAREAGELGPGLGPLLQAGVSLSVWLFAVLITPGGGMVLPQYALIPVTVIVICMLYLVQDVSGRSVVCPGSVSSICAVQGCTERWPGVIGPDISRSQVPQSTACGT